MIIKENYSLKEHNTFHINISCKYFATPKSIEELKDLLNTNISKQNKTLILGGGSNTLFTEDFDGLVIKPNFTNISVIDENDSSVWIEVGAGIDWDSFVAWTVDKNFFGIENLSLIPGNVGSCPVQNIGAYGTEVKDVVTHVNGLYIDTQEYFSLKNADCAFGYRDSIFKNKLKNKIIITTVVFKLSKNSLIKLEYGDIKEKVESLGEVNLLNTRKAIIEIRESKLPDHKQVGNVGSFFQNPIIENKLASGIINNHPNVPNYPIDDRYTKIPAGWLIEKCGWKGKQIGNVAVHDKQALVLINKTGLATGKEILNLAQQIELDVFNKFSISLNKEVNVI